jgi:hypothetical protein
MLYSSLMISRAKLIPILSRTLFVSVRHKAKKRKFYFCVRSALRQINEIITLFFRCFYCYLLFVFILFLCWPCSIWVSALKQIINSLLYSFYWFVDTPYRLLHSYTRVIQSYFTLKCIFLLASLNLHIYPSSPLKISDLKWNTALVFYSYCNVWVWLALVYSKNY